MTLCADNAALVLDEIADAIGTGHAERLDTALSRALAATINPQQLLSGVMLHFAQLRRWRTVVDAGIGVRDVLDGARPKPHFSRRSALEQQLRLWSDASLATATSRLHDATGESRKNYGRQRDRRAARLSGADARWPRSTRARSVRRLALVRGV